MEFQLTVRQPSRCILSDRVPLFVSCRYFLAIPIVLFLLLASCTSYKTAAIGEGDRTFGQRVKDVSLIQDSYIGMAVYDLTRDAWIYRFRSENQFTPASTIKLATYLLVKRTFGDSIPSLYFQKQEDTLWVKGAGDPAFLHPAFTDQEAFDVLDEHLGKIVISLRERNPQRFGPGWAWDDYAYGFQPERSEFPVFGNTVWIRRGEGPGEVTILPGVFRQSVNIDQTLPMPFAREEFSNKMKINPAQFTRDTLFRNIPFRVDVDVLCQVLADTLHRNVVCSDAGSKPGKWSAIWRHHTDTLYRRMLFRSDNFIADQLFLQACGFETGKTYSEWEQLLFGTAGRRGWDKLHWVDGSGLSRYNSATPSAVVRILKALYLQEGWNELVQVLPSPGISGTIRDGFDHIPNVYAKSGSMRGVYCLSGYLQCRTGRRMAFTFMGNHLKDPEAWKATISEFLKFLIEEY